MGSGDHFRQPPPGVLPVRFLRSEPPRGDQKLARARDAASGNPLQPFVGIRMQTELEQIDAQLDGGRDLVDVLSAGAR